MWAFPLAFKKLLQATGLWRRWESNPRTNPASALCREDGCGVLKAGRIYEGHGGESPGDAAGKAEYAEQRIRELGEINREIKTISGKRMNELSLLRVTACEQGQRIRELEEDSKAKLDATCERIRELEAALAYAEDALCVERGVSAALRAHVRSQLTSRGGGHMTDSLNKRVRELAEQSGNGWISVENDDEDAAQTLWEGFYEQALEELAAKNGEDT